MYSILCSNQINWEALIAFFALIVSVTSVIFTYKQIRLQRTHNFKTVKPVGNIRLGDYENNIFVKIENNGAGPLIIKGINIKNGGLETKDSLIEILPSDLTKRVTWTNFTGSYEGRAILPGNCLELLVWTINKSYNELPIERIKQDRDDIKFY